MSKKVVLITGSSRGIGLGIVKEYLERGYQVLASCRNPEKASELQEVLKKHGQRPPLQLDVSSVSSIKDCQGALSGQIDHLDVLVNNAGVSNKNHPDDGASTADPSEFNDIINTNVTGVLVATQAFLPMLLRSPDPRVINISSGLGSISESPRFTTTSYQCSKAALNMLTKCFADDVKAATFVAVHPGWVQTDMGSTGNRKPPVTVAESAGGIVSAAHGITREQSGTFIDFKGRTLGY